MDLPLAWSEPSPPYRPWKVLFTARSGTFHHPLPRFARPILAHAAGARFQFVERQHGKTIHSCVPAEWRLARVACKSTAISLPICSRICSLKLHSLQCQEKNEFVTHFFEFFSFIGKSWQRRPNRWVLFLGGGILRHIRRGSS